MIHLKSLPTPSVCNVNYLFMISEMSDRPIYRRAGFGEIEFEHLGLRPSQFKLGKQLFVASHVQNVEEMAKNGEPLKITAICIPQASVMAKPYDLEMRLDLSRSVIPKTMKCSCRFGEGGMCKHMAGLIIYINAHRDESQTNETCGFVNPSTFGKLLYPKGEELEKIENIEEKFLCPKLKFENITHEAKLRLKRLMEASGCTKSPIYKICAISKPYEGTL